MNIERIIQILLLLALLGVVCWAILAFVPLPYPFGQIIIAVAVILVILGLLREFGGSLRA